MDVAVRETALGALLVVDGREHVGLRPELAHRQEDALRAAQVEQEIVNERDALRRRRLGVFPLHRRRSLGKAGATGEPRSRDRRNPVIRMIAMNKSPKTLAAALGITALVAFPAGAGPERG